MEQYQALNMIVLYHGNCKHSLINSLQFTDNTFTHSNLLTVLSHVVDTNKVMNYYLSVPDSVIEKIREHSKDRHAKYVCPLIDEILYVYFP